MTTLEQQEKPSVFACPTCRARMAEAEVKCPACGRWVRLPRNDLLVSMSEVPALEGPGQEFGRMPWKELSPSIAFVVAVLLMFVGTRHAPGMLFAGGALAVASIIAAAVLEARADSRAARESGDPAAMSALQMSSDYHVTVRRRRR